MIFFDNASTTKVLKEVSEVISFYNEQNYFNPSSMYKEGVSLSRELLGAKTELINLLHANGGDVVFTSGATESNNLAILGSLTGNKNAEYIFSEANTQAFIMWLKT